MFLKVCQKKKRSLNPWMSKFDGDGTSSKRTSFPKKLSSLHGWLKTASIVNKTSRTSRKWKITPRKSTWRSRWQKLHTTP
jgi:hypothetical protein